MIEKKPELVSCAQARDMDIENYLASLGIREQKIRGNCYWYCSPLRNEKTPSFKVDRRLNRWYDFGSGKGGNLIDFGILFFNCTVGQFLQRLSWGESNFTSVSFLRGPDTQPYGKITIINSAPLCLPALFQYLGNRKIPVDIASQYCSEVKFSIGAKTNFAIGFANDQGGYELRNKFFKGSSTPKTITWKKYGHSTVSVFEGFFDFLSFLAINRNTAIKTDFLTLNSLSFFARSMTELLTYKEVNLYLDNNKSGQNCSKEALAKSNKFLDRSSLYCGHEDLNDFLCSGGAFPDEAGVMPEKPP